MTIDEIYAEGNSIIDFTQYEIEFISNKVNKKTDVSVNQDVLLDYLKNLENTGITKSTKLRVTANIATQPSRYQFLLQMLESIDGQFDEIRIYLNNYKYIPQELQKYNCYIGKDLTDNGKFFWSNNENEYYFTLDDDIIYPPDYVEKTLPLIQDRIVTYHGRNLYGLNQPYYNNHRVYSFYKNLSKEVKLDVGGTGVMAFSTNNFKPNLWKSPNMKMSDLIISLEAAVYGLDIICLPRESNWLNPIEYYNDGIYTENMFNDSKQRIFADMILTHKSSNNNLDRTYLAPIMSRSSVEVLAEKIKTLKTDDNKFLYFLGSSDGSAPIYLSKLINFEFTLSVDLTDERVIVGTSKIDKSEDKRKIQFINQSYDKLKFAQNSIVVMNDLVLLDEYSVEIWKNLPHGCHFITTKILNEIPVSKLECVTKNELKFQYYYYIKDSGEVLRNQNLYNKTFIINLDDNPHAEYRFNNLKKKLDHFINPVRFIATKGRSDDYQRFVTEDWNKKIFDGITDRYINMSDGEVGCCMSHLRIWQKIVEDDLGICLVLEDDALRITPGFEHYLDELITNLPNDWDILLVGFMILNSNCQRVDDNFYKIKDFLLTHSYLINKRGASKLLQNLPINAPVDTFLSSLSDKVNIYRHDFIRQRDGKRKNSYLIQQLSESSFIKHTNVIISRAEDTLLTQQKKHIKL